MSPPNKPPVVDWLAIEADYRACIKPLRLIASPEGADLVESLMDVLSEPVEQEGSEQAARRRAKQRDALNRALGLDGRVDTLKRLTETSGAREQRGLAAGQGLARKAESQSSEPPTVTDAG